VARAFGGPPTLAPWEKVLAQSDRAAKQQASDDPNSEFFDVERFMRD
jgi:hypothetical protein